MLRAEDLWVEKDAGGGAVAVLRGVNLVIPPGRVTVLLGETGAGKTLLARSLCGLLPRGFRVSRGRILFGGRPLSAPGDWDGVRGRGIFYAPQNAAASFNPVLTIGRQIGECSRIGAVELEDLLARLLIPDPRRVLRSHAFALSGGENQRCLLALALACRPDVLILDEPTSEIDAAAHDSFVRVLLECQRARSMTVLLISHHLGFIHAINQGLCVMSGGRIVDAGNQGAVLAAPGHEYTREIAAYLAAT